MTVEILNSSEHRLPKQFIDWWGERIFKELKGEKGLKRKKILYLVFLGPKRAGELNRRYRGKAYATDVLSFSPVEEESLGELVFCPEVLDRQARDHGLSFRFELGYMMIHGVLHLLGYEHEKGGIRAEKMYNLQDSIFETLCRRWRSREDKRNGKRTKKRDRKRDRKRKT